MKSGIVIIFAAWMIVLFLVFAAGLLNQPVRAKSKTEKAVKFCLAMIVIMAIFWLGHTDRAQIKFAGEVIAGGLLAGAQD